MSITEATGDDVQRLVNANLKLIEARDEWVYDANSQNLVTRHHHAAYIQALGHMLTLTEYPGIAVDQTREVADDVGGQIRYIAAMTEKHLPKEFTQQRVAEGLAKLVSAKISLINAACLYVDGYLEKAYTIEPVEAESSSAELVELELGITLGC